jgi:hypothetical protein
LIAGVNNAQSDVFLYDRTLGQLELISRTTGGSSGNAASVSPAFSDDGR